jgi:hypothetical protein
MARHKLGANFWPAQGKRETTASLQQPQKRKKSSLLPLKARLKTMGGNDTPGAYGATRLG